MNLYIANCTQQKHIFFYRLPEVANLLQQDIMPGAQIVIENILQDVADNIIAQHEIYGIVSSNRMKKGCRSLIYQCNKELSQTQIRDAMEERHEDITNLAKESRDYSVAAFYHQTEETFNSMGISGNVPEIKIEIQGEPIDKEVGRPTSQQLITDRNA